MWEDDAKYRESGLLIAFHQTAEGCGLYVRDEYASVTRPVKELKAFRRVHIPAGESVKVEFEITPDMLACWSGKGDVWTVEPGEFTLMVGSSSADKDLQSLSLHVD